MLLGLGTIFQPKANIDDHWSKSPRVEIVVNAPADESGEPSEPHLEDAALTGQHCA